LIHRLIFRFSSNPQTPLLSIPLSPRDLTKKMTISSSLAPSSLQTVSHTLVLRSSEEEESNRRSQRKRRRKNMGTRRKISCRRWMKRYKRWSRLNEAVGHVDVSATP
jgi:hypothetical protein